MEHPSPDNTLKKTAVALMVISACVAWVFYMAWSSRIAMRTAIMPSLPERTTPLAVGLVLGLIFAATVIFGSSVGRDLKKIATQFAVGFGLGLLSSLHIYEVCVYLFPGDTVQYETDYQIVIPGRISENSRRCKAWLKIKDPNTHRWIDICTTPSDLDAQRKRGMNAIWVNAYTNTVGSYIINYAFIYK